MPTTIDSAGIIFNDASVLTSANIGTAQIAANAVGATQIADGSVTAAKLGTTERKQICKAWGVFDGVNPLALLSNYNIAGFARVPTTTAGQYRITFQNAMPNADYAIVIGASTTTGTTWNMPVQHTTLESNVGFDILFGASEIISQYFNCNKFYIAVFA